MSAQDIPVTNIDLSHHLQRQIIMKLRQSGDQSYQGLKPDGIEGNAFNYHLRQLKQLQLVEGSAKLYTLTPRGHLVADGFSSPAARLMMRPYAHTSILATSGDKVLLYKATRQPLSGIYTIPSGKMRYGDSLRASISRELERREIHNDYIANVLCVVNFRYQLAGEVIIHRPGTIWHVDYHGELRQSRTQNGVSDWYDRKNLDALDVLSPEVILALERLDTGTDLPIDSEWELPR